MATYAKRSCSVCGIQRPQPEMSLHQVTPVGVNGRPLAPRTKWFCRHHSPHYENTFERRQLEAEADLYAKKKRLWAEEQERRRLANVEKREWAGDASAVTAQQTNGNTRVNDPRDDVSGSIDNEGPPSSAEGPPFTINCDTMKPVGFKRKGLIQRLLSVFLGKK